MRKFIVPLIIFIPFLMQAYTFDLGIQLNSTTNFANVPGVSDSRATGFGFGSGIFSLFPVRDRLKTGISLQYTGYNYGFSDVALGHTTIYYKLYISNFTTELLTTYSFPPYKSFIPKVLAGIMLNYGVNGRYFTNISGGRTTTITYLTKNDLNTDILINIGFIMKYRTSLYDKILYISPVINLIYNLTGSGSNIGYINLNYSPNLTVLLNLNISMPMQIDNQ